jgi:hypothetical protein
MLDCDVCTFYYGGSVESLEKSANDGCLTCSILLDGINTIPFIQENGTAFRGRFTFIEKGGSGPLVLGIENPLPVTAIKFYTRHGRFRTSRFTAI